MSFCPSICPSVHPYVLLSIQMSFCPFFAKWTLKISLGNIIEIFFRIYLYANIRDSIILSRCLLFDRQVLSTLFVSVCPLLSTLFVSVCPHFQMFAFWLSYFVYTFWPSCFVYTFYVHLSTFVLYIYIQANLTFSIRHSNIYNFLSSVYFVKKMSTVFCLSVYFIPKYTNKQIIWLSLSNIQMSRILVSVCPHMSRNIVSVCPHISRDFVYVCPHVSRNFYSQNMFYFLMYQKYQTKLIFTPSLA